MATSSTGTDSGITKTHAFSAEKYGNRIKLFHNDTFRIQLQRYVSNTYNIKSSIDLTDVQNVNVELIGTKQNVKEAREMLKSLFESMQEQIFNRDKTDQRGKV